MALTASERTMRYRAQPEKAELIRVAKARYYQEHKDDLKARAVNSTRTQQANRPAHFWLRTLRNRAKQQGHDFDLTEEFLVELFRPMTCSATGLPLKWPDVDRGHRAKQPWAPSVDRLDCSKGYVQGNVRLVCHLYNQAKMEWGDAEVLHMAQALVKHADCK